MLSQLLSGVSPPRRAARPSSAPRQGSFKGFGRAGARLRAGAGVWDRHSPACGARFIPEAAGSPRAPWLTHACAATRSAREHTADTCPSPAGTSLWYSPGAPWGQTSAVTAERLFQGRAGALSMYLTELADVRWLRVNFVGYAFPHLCLPI